MIEFDRKNDRKNVVVCRPTARERFVFLGVQLAVGRTSADDYFPASSILMACSAATRPEVIANDEAEPSQRKS